MITLPKTPVAPLLDALFAQADAVHPMADPSFASISTEERTLCDTGIQPVKVEGKGRPLDYGQEHRLYTDAQRTALAIRDGGCRRASCDRPASWAEAHPIQHYAHGGATSLANGILLCSTEHMDLHNSGAHIGHEQHRDMYVWVDADGTRTDMPTKARIQERIRANAA